MPVSKEDEEYWRAPYKAPDEDGYLSHEEQDLIKRAVRLWDVREESSLVFSGVPQSVCDKMDLQRILDLVIVKLRSMK